MPRQAGFLVVLSGPSAVGKNTLVEAVRPRIPDLVYSVSATTRPPRPGERAGEDYDFLSPEEFERRHRAGEFLEAANFLGYRYGTPRRQVEAALARGQTILLDIDIQGAEQIKARMPGAVFVFLLPPSLAELARRIKGRGKDSREVASQRLRSAAQEVAAVASYDYVVLNDDPERAAQDLESIIRAERCRVSRRDCAELVRRLRAGGVLQRDDESAPAGRDS